MMRRMNRPGRAGALGALILTLAVVLSAAAEERPILRLSSPPEAERTIELAPQSTRTFVFRAFNDSGMPATCESSVELPAGWKLLVPETSFALAPREDSPRLVGIFIPAKAAAGDYSVRYRIRPAGSAEWASRVVMVRVPAVSALTLQTVASPDFVRAGDSYRMRFLVLNCGNAEAEIALAARSPEGLAVQIAPPNVRLKPGESGDFRVTVETDAALRRLLIHRLAVSATTSSPGSKSVQAVVSTEVQVVPLVSGAADYFRRLPLQFSAIGLFNPAAQTSGQFRVEGSGALDAAGHQTIDILLRGPGLRDMLNFGLQQEEYRLTFDAPGASIRLGDHIFGLSKLTESGRYGRGAGADFSLAKIIGVQAYYAENPQGVLLERRRQKAARLTVSPGAHFQIGANFVATRTSASPEDRTLSVQGRWTSKPLTVNAEYAVGARPGTAADGSGRALWLDAAGRLGTAVFQTAYIDAGATFPGYYRNLFYRSAQASWQPASAIGFRASFQDQRLRVPSLLYISNLAETSVLAGGQVDVASGVRLSLDYRRTDRQDLSPSGTFNYRDETLRAGVFSFFGTRNARASVDIGRTRNFLTGQTAPLKEFDASVSFEPVSGLSLGASATYRDQARDFTGEKLRNLDLRLDAGLKWSGTRLEVNYRTSFRREFARQWSEDATLDDPFFLSHRLDMLEAALSHQFRNGQTAAIRFRGASPLDASFLGSNSLRHFMVSFEYSIPLRLPLGRRSDVGKISGRVLDAEAPGRGLAQVLVRANDLATLTDERGAFVFHGVKPDTYYLSLDPKTVRSGQIPVQPGPLSVAVEGAAEKNVDIALARAGGIDGRIVLVAPVSSDGRTLDVQTASPAGLSGTLLEARQGDSVYVQTTDAEGRFRFDELRPGRWEITVDPGSLPEFSKAEKETTIIELGAGETLSPTIRVLQRRREIQFVDGGDLTVGKSRRTDAPDAPLPAPAATAPKGNAAILIQAGAFSTWENAERVRRSISGLCPDVKIQKTVSAGRLFYRLLISCRGAADAEELIRKLRERGVEAVLTSANHRR
jgi:hypothetical protein